MTSRTTTASQPHLFQDDSPAASSRLAPGGGAPSESALIGLAVALGAEEVPEWSEEEERLARSSDSPPPDVVARARKAILAGRDVLGEAFCALRSPEIRRRQGATYTPGAIVSAMLDWAERKGTPDRIVDPGTGSGRFLVAGGKRFPHAQLVGVERDPVAALLARGNLAACGFASRARVLLEDYRRFSLPPIAGLTLYVGNPPYVRHHLLEPEWKRWLSGEAAKRRLPSSQLAGLHVHFFLATLSKASPGDVGTFITASEWLDVNYGALLRSAFLGELGGERIVVIDPAARPFTDAATTAAITFFQVAQRPATIEIGRVSGIEQLSDPAAVTPIRRERLEGEQRWSHLTRQPKRHPEGYAELGELCRVHRGQVTGLNRVWIAGSHSVGLPERVTFPSITRARELFEAGRELSDPLSLKRVIDLPPELDVLDERERAQVERFLRIARGMGADRGYIATNRKAWWSVGLREPAPILTTYMARRPPVFVRNRADARHINIAHGIYPREPMSDRALAALADYLTRTTRIEAGRTYAGGLTKFEPREVERLLIPAPGLLEQGPA